VLVCTEVHHNPVSVIENYPSVMGELSMYNRELSECTRGSLGDSQSDGDSPSVMGNSPSIVGDSKCSGGFQVQ